MTPEEQAQVTNLQGIIEQLKEKLAISLTDNESLQKSNDELREEAAAASRRADEIGNLNAAITTRLQSVEAQLLTTAQQRDQFKAGHEKSQRQIGEMMQRINLMKSLEKPKPLTADTGRNA